MHSHPHHKKRARKQLFPIIVISISILMMLFIAVASAAPTQRVAPGAAAPETAVVTDSVPLKINSSEDFPDLSAQNDSVLSPIDRWLGTAVLLLLFGVIGYALLNYSID